jgi:photosystem II stability/assembly factor-like uncharacterized protein
MRKHFILLAFLAVCSGLYFGFTYGEKTDQSPVFINSEFQGNSNPYLAKDFLERWYEPYGMITPELRQQMVSEVEKMPTDASAINGWIQMGPNGQRVYSDPGTNYYSGRILDIEVDGTPSTRLGTASGGLWGFVFIIIGFPVPLSDNLNNTLNIGSFDSKQGDANTILVGTGEAAYNNGAGLFKTTNGGSTYTQIPMTPTPASFFKLRYDPTNVNIVHAACNTGYYRSTDGGNTWTRHQLTARVTDLAINPSNSDIIYAPVWGDGMYKTVNGGLNWTKITTGGIPTTNFGRSSISIANSSPNTVYVNVSKNSDDLTLGVFKTTNGGTTWTDVKPVAEFHAFGWYNNSCGVSPTDPNRIVVGGLTLWRSTNGGTSWTQVSNAHADQHVVTWSSDGTKCWAGNDGGMQFSDDAGITWNYNANYLPITQYVIFEVAPNGQYCYGGSQDNGISGTTNRGVNWWHWIGGDGGGTAIDPVTPSKIAVTNGVYGGSYAFRRLLTTNNGANWSFIDAGIDPSTQWYHRIRNDKVSPVYLYNNSGPFVYRSTNYGTSWTKTNPAAFVTDVSDMSVSRYNGGLGSSVVYACLNNAGTKLMVYDGTSWVNRSAGLGNGTVRHVEPHMTNVSTGYALMNGLAAGQKVYKTTNRGENWTNISGDMPNVPMSAIIPHPTDNNKLYVGSEMGCYRTTNGGTNWHRWNNDMANATQVTEMGYIDSISANGKFFVVAATYGRSIYYREISGDDPIAVTGNQFTIPQHYKLNQNYPNPFNPATKIKFELPTNDFVKLEVFDLLGRNVKTLVNGDMNAGYHTIDFNASEFSSGIYFYRITTSKLVDTKKMMLVK